MPEPKKVSIREWIWTQYLPSEVMADFEKLFALPEKWRTADLVALAVHERIIISEFIELVARELEGVLGKSA